MLRVSFPSKLTTCLSRNLFKFRKSINRIRVLNAPFYINTEKSPMVKFVFTLIFFGLLTNCSSSVSTNLDKKNFQEYFSAATVVIYQHEQYIPNHYQFIGLVEGHDCQEKNYHAAPDKINARTKARQQAFDKMANAIVFTGCAELTPEQLTQLRQSNDAQQCHAITICYGKAYVVDANSEQ